jgi:RNA polymerase sigma-70 factor (ECF subfamily)
MLLFVLLNDSEKESITRLVLRVARGDETALIEIYNLVGGRLLSVAMGITRDIHLAEDVLSESFLKISKYAHQFRGGQGYYYL